MEQDKRNFSLYNLAGTIIRLSYVHTYILPSISRRIGIHVWAFIRHDNYTFSQHLPRQTVAKSLYSCSVVHSIDHSPRLPLFSIMPPRKSNLSQTAITGDEGTPSKDKERDGVNIEVSDNFNVFIAQSQLHSCFQSNSVAVAFLTILLDRISPFLGPWSSVSRKASFLQIHKYRKMLSQQ